MDVYRGKPRGKSIITERAAYIRPIRAPASWGRKADYSQSAQEFPGVKFILCAAFSLGAEGWSVRAPLSLQRSCWSVSPGYSSYHKEFR